MHFQQVFAEVAVDVPTSRERTFTYSIPRDLNLKLGSAVMVPFGKRRVQGIVFKLSNSSPIEDTRPVLTVSEKIPPLNNIQIELARWISVYYMSTLFESAALMLPPGGRTRLKTFLSVGSPIDNGELGRLTSFQNTVLQYLQTNPLVSEDKIVRTMGNRSLAAVKKLEDLGFAKKTHRWTGAKVRHKTETYVSVISQSSWNKLPAIGPNARQQQKAVSQLLDIDGTVTLSTARKQFGSSAINCLLQKGYLKKNQVIVERDPLLGRDFEAVSPVKLNEPQTQATAAVREALNNPTRNSRKVLLEGVTGSGKTEIYLDAVQHCLQLGKRAIVMVPEIALTHQTIERFAGRFPNRIALLHSGLSNGERFDQWWKIQQQEYDIVIGARSAIFAPQVNLGLIIMDEEHEWTYKQNDVAPRYHTRSVALKLSELSRAVLLMGSASPDIGTYHRSLSKKVKLLRLPERIVSKRGRSGLARPEIVDMREELRRGNSQMFSQSLVQQMERVLENKSQGILFLNKRGSASFIQCRNCGFSLPCRRCDTSMTYHKFLERMMCHYCGQQLIPPSKCPECLAFRMVYRGIGTQSVEDEIKNHFPGANVLRWDRDTITGRTSHEEMLRSFRSGDNQFLVGTQMVTKGLHFPNVTLVGIISADSGTNLPDYRAGERTFQLLCQVAGRSGRGDIEGSVIIQTYQPDNYAIQAAAQQNYPAFYRKEIAYRREHHNPPFSRLIRLVFKHPNNAQAEREADHLLKKLKLIRQVWGLGNIELLGPTPSFPPRIKGNYRWQLILRGSEPRKILDKIEYMRNWEIDVDPVGLD